jgi:hypothetical protein
VKKTKVATKANVVRTSIKVLKNGQSWHGGNHKWSLPELIDNTWKPGAWTSAINPVWCESGWHLTNNPVAWWDDGEGVVAYLVEYEGATAGPDLTASDDPTKFAVERCRLLRPLTSAELAEKGIFLAGELDELKDGRYILGGDAHVRSLNGSARVDRMYGSARVESMYGSASVESMYGSASVESMYGSARVESMYGSARVESMDGSARVDRMYGSARVESMYGSASVESMYGSASVGSMYGSATVHASGDAIVVVRRGSPIVTLRGRASCVDYRTVKPMFHVADEDKVLTLTGDSTTSPSDPK